MLCISLTHASITGAIDAAGTVQTICIRVNGCSSRSCWAPLCHPCGVFRLFLSMFPTASAVGYVVSSLRDFRRNRVASLRKLPQAAGGQVR